MAFGATPVCPCLKSNKATPEVVLCSEFNEFWTVRFTAEEIEEMARALWG